MCLWNMNAPSGNEVQNSYCQCKGNKSMTLVKLVSLKGFHLLSMHAKYESLTGKN